MTNHQIELSDRERELVTLYARAHDITEDEAASKLFSEAMRDKYRKGFGKAPATVYPIKKGAA